METIREAIEAAARRFPDKDFLVSAADGRRLRYGELARRTEHVVRRYAGLGLSTGDRVALLLPNTEDLVLGFLAAAAGGFAANPLNPRLTSAEIAAILADSKPRLLVSDAAHAETVREALARLASPPLVLSIDGAATGALPFEVGGDGPLPRRPDPTDTAMLLYTSGTTGRSKGAMITHHNLAVNCEEIRRWLDLGSDDRFLCIMPLFHANGLVITVTTPLRLGATVILSDRFHASTFWETVDRHRPTLFGSVATMLGLLLERPDPPPRLRRDSLRYALCGSAPVPVEVIQRFEARFGMPIVEGYGLTESTCRATFNPPNRRRPGSIGVPIGNELRVVDDSGRDCATGERGEIWLRGGNVMAGYFDDPEATAQAIDARGWLRTGDVAYRDAEGYLFVVGRKSDMIIRAGENIYPREIEEALYRHPAVAEAAVYGVSHPLYGEEVAAAVVLREGASASEAELREHCARTIAPFKLPKTLDVRSDLPKGPTGKILKTALRREHAAAANAPTSR